MNYFSLPWINFYLHSILWINFLWYSELFLHPLWSLAVLGMWENCAPKLGRVLYSATIVFIVKHGHGWSKSFHCRRSKVYLNQLTSLIEHGPSCEPRSTTVSTQPVVSLLHDLHLSGQSGQTDSTFTSSPRSPDNADSPQSNERSVYGTYEQIFYSLRSSKRN